jgi:hypothetical protein
MNRRLAGMVVAALREDWGAEQREAFAEFDERDWMRAKEWMDASGLALYFMARVKELGVADVMPAEMLHRLERRHAENRIKTEEMFDEFVKINMQLQRARLSYANLNGFACAPRSYGDPSLRCEEGLEFVMSRRDGGRCGQVLDQLGYGLVDASTDRWEFRSGGDSLKADCERCSARSVAVHLVADDGATPGRSVRDDRLSRLQLQLWEGFEFPALSERDKFIGQALQVFEQLQQEWIEAAGVYELARCIQSHVDDEAFWQEVVATIGADRTMRVGIGVAAAIAGRAFGVEAPAAFVACTIGELPVKVRLWVERYGDEVLLAEFPGSKLYLLLQEALSERRADWRRRLFARSPPVRRVLAGRRLPKFLARLRFHVLQGLRYLIEAQRWKRFVAASGG